MYKMNAPWPELTPLFRYFEELVKCRCFPDLLMLEVFPNAKELTESAAAYSAVRKSRMFELRDPEVTVIAVADGCTPRTATMFAYRSAWQCWSVDPRLKDGWETKVKRLHVIPERVEDCDPIHFEKLVLVAVHSHADLRVACGKFTADRRLVVSIPCCVKQERERAPDLSYVDKGIWSPENRVLVWRDDYNDCSLRSNGQLR